MVVVMTYLTRSVLASDQNRWLWCEGLHCLVSDGQLGVGRRLHREIRTAFRWLLWPEPASNSEEICQVGASCLLTVNLSNADITTGICWDCFADVCDESESYMSIPSLYIEGKHYASENCCQDICLSVLVLYEVMPLSSLWHCRSHCHSHRYCHTQ